ncbi:MAG: PEP-CTERM sorting domain-containing protein [Pirellula sp.]|jgi:hypothetical protein
MKRQLVCAFFCVLAYTFCLPQVNADVLVLSEDKPQSGSNPEIRINTRAIYLGRLFQGQSVSGGLTTFTSFDSAVTIREAVNVQLWAGNGSSQFELNIANFVDTGARFTQTTGNPTTVWANGSADGSISIPFAPQVGQQLMTTFRSAGHLDFWLVGTPTSTFSAPSGHNSGGGGSTAFPFYAGFSAVPEPSSMLLCGLGLGGLYAWRRRRSAKEMMA